ncbi:MAG TPA: helix-turn-helix domain-containing protein [Armatimonadota bacterium]|nr:helix-turn-helix domain-containing protein [Armatimonadota bacterium]
MLHPFYQWNFPDPDFPFSILENPAHGSFSLHRHHFVEIVYIIAGHGTHSINDSVSTIEAGDCFVIPTDSVHGYADATALHLVNILFDPRLLEPFQQELNALPGYHALFTLEPSYRRQHDSRGRLRPTLAQRLAITETVRQLLAEWKGRKPGYRGKTLALFLQLLIDVSRYYQESEQKPSAQLVQIGAAISKIEQDYASPLSIRELAESVNMSERNLARRFREGVGMTPIDYLIHLRIRRASQLLRDTPHSVAEIAAAVGMEDSNYFTRQFKRLMGVSPRDFRQDQR